MGDLKVIGPRKLHPYLLKRRGMDTLFKQNLLRLRQGTTPLSFGEALFPNSWLPMGQEMKPKVKAIEVEAFTEKKQVLESLERFAQETSLKLESPIIPVEGGEIALKSDPHWGQVEVCETVAQLQATLTLPPEILSILFKNKKSPQILFVTESFRKWSDIQPELKGGFVDELLAGFPLKTAELFERMIQAMKLTPEEVCLYPIENEEVDLTSEALRVAAFYKPQVIVTLGASATQKLLKGQNRLSVVHGQFFPKTMDNVATFQLVPLFHPSIIETNQNMKKTAWADMQKIMKFLKKLP